MPIEIERKFLVRDTSILTNAEGVHYRQGYIPASNATVRVRIAGDRGYLTIKGPSEGISRSEYEYEIPLEEARELLDSTCDPAQVEKTRYHLPHAKKVWEVDLFHGANSGLVLAEIELSRPNEEFAIPDWVGKEVSHDKRYFNAYLARYPFQSWQWQ